MRTIHTSTPTMISLFPEFRNMYAKYLPEELINLYLINDPLHGLVFSTVYSNYDPDENCNDYESEFQHSGIRPPVFKDSLELKRWFLDQSVEMHVYNMNVFPDCYTPELISEGYVYVDSYDSEADILDEILCGFQEEADRDFDFQKRHRFIEECISTGLLKIKKGCAGFLLFTRDGEKFKQELMNA